MEMEIANAYERIYTNRMYVYMVYNDYLGVVKTLVHSGKIDEHDLFIFMKGTEIKPSLTLLWELGTGRAPDEYPISFSQDPLIWSNYSDLTRPHPKWWFSKGNPLISGKARLVKYCNLTRLIRETSILRRGSKKGCWAGGGREGQMRSGNPRKGQVARWAWLGRSS